MQHKKYCYEYMHNHIRSDERVPCVNILIDVGKILMRNNHFFKKKSNCNIKDATQTHTNKHGVN